MRQQCSTFVLAFVLAALPAAADTLAINFSNTTGEPLSNPPMTLGWAFQVNNPLNVTSLAFFDSGQNGLAESHPIGLWTASGTLVVSATVDSGTVNPLQDKFRSVAVAPALLMPGTYRIGALFTSSADTNIFPTFTTGFTIAPDITYLRGASAVGSTLTNPTPTFFSMGPAYFGPNFGYASVPEPSSMMLASSAMVVAAFAARRRLTR